MSPSRQEQLETTRRRILDAASHLLREQGAGGFTMDDLAHRASVARATVYEHFHSKRAVLDALVVERSAVLSPQVDIDTDDPIGATRVLIDAACTHWSANEDEARELHLLAAERRSGKSPTTVARLRDLAAALARTGHLHAPWNATSVEAALDLLVSFETYARLRARGASRDDIAALLTELALTIVAPTEPAGAPRT